MFSQEDSSLSRGYEGSGLGLSIAKGIVKLLNGEIKVNSQKGNGSEFIVKIPYSEFEQSNVNVINENIEIQEKTKPLILIAEDDILNYMYLKSLLRKWDYKYLYAKNGAEAVEICKQNKEITLVLMDIKMPVMTGLEATKLIREFWTELPIIAATAYAQTGEEESFAEAGFDGYLSKPFTDLDLLSVIKKFS